MEQEEVEEGGEGVQAIALTIVGVGAGAAVVDQAVGTGGKKRAKWSRKGGH